MGDAYDDAAATFDEEEYLRWVDEEKERQRKERHGNRIAKAATGRPVDKVLKRLEKISGLLR